MAYAEAISKLEPSPFLFAMIGCIIKYLALRKDIDSIDKFKVLHVFYFLHVYNARFTEYNFCIYIDKH